MNKNTFGGINMKEGFKKWGIYGVILLGVIFCVSFAIGFFISKNDTDTEEAPVFVNYVPEIEDTEEQELSEVVSYYLINQQDGKISLYYVDGEVPIEIKSEEFSSGVFPEADILMLKEGIVLESAEDALQAWENFVS